MYNEDIKMEFCKEMGYTQRSNGIAWAFSRMEPYETEARRDIAEMNKDECISTISRMAKKYQALGYPHRHTYQNVWRSGRYYELYKIEQSGVDIFDRANQPVIEDVFRHKKNYFDILKMYSFYKKAFSLE